MATDLGRPFPPHYRGIPTHMASRDYAIWQRYHTLHWQSFLRFYFDAAVGDGAKIPPGTPDNLAKGWTRLTQKRIDVIAVRTDSVWVVEVRDSAGTSAVGAVMSYLHLLRDDNPFSLPLRGAILTDHADQDMKGIMKDFGIQLIEV